MAAFDAICRAAAVCLLFLGLEVAEFHGEARAALGHPCPRRALRPSPGLVAYVLQPSVARHPWLAPSAALRPSAYCFLGSKWLNSMEKLARPWVTERRAVVKPNIAASGASASMLSVPGLDSEP